MYKQTSYVSFGWIFHGSCKIHIFPSIRISWKAFLVCAIKCLCWLYILKWLFKWQFYAGNENIMCVIIYMRFITSCFAFSWFLISGSPTYILMLILILEMENSKFFHNQFNLIKQRNIFQDYQWFILIQKNIMSRK